MLTQYKTIMFAMFGGIVLGGISLFGLYTLYQDHQQINAVVNYLTTQSQQKQSTQENNISPKK